MEALNAVTGWNLTLDEAHKIAERQWNMIRLFGGREGFKREYDMLPVRWMEEPDPGRPDEGRADADRKPWSS